MEKPAGEDRATIRSAQHPLLKRMGAILAGVAKDACVLEGDRLIRDAQKSNARFEVVLVSERRERLAREFESAGLQVRLVEAELLERKSGLKHSPGVAAICSLPRTWTIDELPVTQRTLLLVAAGVSDPGNLGAMARSAEAMGASAVVVVAGGASPWNDKALRGSMGSLLRIPVVECCTAADAQGALRRRGVRLVAAATRNGIDSWRFDWSGPIALWVGPETGENPSEMAGFERVTIPMVGGVESLNVTVAAGMLLLSAARWGDRRP